MLFQVTSPAVAGDPLRSWLESPESSRPQQVRTIVKRSFPVNETGEPPALQDSARMYNKPCMMESVFWICAFLYLLPYALYPAFLGVLSLASGRKRRNASFDTDLGFNPDVSVLIAARNEAGVIAGRIANLREQDYRGRIEILVGSDASDDGTDDIVRSLESEDVQLYRSDTRLGKPGILQRLAAMAGGEILVFTDADTVFAPGTVARLAAPFADPKTGCVDGSRRNSLSTSSCESTYWKYERMIKVLCSRIGAVLGATGAVFALRRSLFRPLTPKRADDFELAVMPRIEGYTCLYNDEAIAMEPTPDDSRQFHRMTRIVSWMFTSALLLMAKAAGRGRLLLVLQILVHKVCRWLAGLFLAGATVTAFLLMGNPFFAVVFAALAAFHLLAILGAVAGDRLPSKLMLPYYFWLMNAASLTGLLRLVTGASIETWDRGPAGGGG
jgi:cellulose synthase/poly-beta-1,6-N-acetylglucosamine synthase-like glycosyltransferase